jgi:hypothetical protein
MPLASFLYSLRTNKIEHLKQVSFNLWRLQFLAISAYNKGHGPVNSNETEVLFEFVTPTKINNEAS